MEINIGDRVRVIDVGLDFYEKCLIGRIGIVVKKQKISWDKDLSSCGIDFGERIADLTHTLDGRLPQYTGRYMSSRSLELISETNHSPILCEFCNKEIKNSDKLINVDNELMCKECFEKNKDKYFFCTSCRKYHKIENKVDTEKLCIKETDICKSCLFRNYFVCGFCGKYEKNHNYRYIDSEICCLKCYEEKTKYFIKGYHENPKLKFYRNKKEYATSRNFKGYGVELEVGKGGRRNEVSENVIKLLNEEVYTMHDGSINNGFEIITHPHDEEALLNMNWKKTFDYLIEEGYDSHTNGTCGLHVHISKSLFDNDNSIAKMIYFYENFKEDILKFSRRTRNQIGSWSKFYTDWGSSPDMEECKRIFRNYTTRYRGHSYRYKAVNLQNRSTVEVRLMRGSIKYETFMSSLKFVIAIAKRSNTIKEEDLSDYTKWLEGIDEETINYMKERQCFSKLYE